MGNAFIAFLVAVGGATWIYLKMMKQSGNNLKSSIIVAGTSALVIFVLALVILGMIVHD